MKLLNEVKMSPSVFAKGLVKSQGQGALIGFEFEVVVPIKSYEGLQITSSTPDYTDSLPKFLDWIRKSSDSFSEEIQFEISEDYTNWAKANTKELLQSLSEAGLEKLESLYNQYYDKPSLINMTKFITLAPRKDIQKHMSDFLELEDYEETDDYDSLFLHYEHVTKFKNFIADVYGNVTEIFKQYELKYAPASDKEPDDRYHLVKNYAKEVIEQEVAKTQVHIIDIAKTVPKNLTDWYIEPDATVKSPQRFEKAGVEVVTPPLQPEAAMQALDAFYKASKRNGWETNASTGLHINVSLPQRIDVLKLVMFLGDRYVLKAFGREDSRMAISVLKSLETGSAQDDINTLSPEAIKRLMLAANYFADDHYASISFETNPDTLKKNKYVSFRHAGGDYLNDLPKIKDTIGRFVTAMLIAADPNAHKQEYIKKLSKLVGNKNEDQ